jgi:hypothetical protein
MSATTTQAGTVHLMLLGEGDYEVPVAGDTPVSFGELLQGLGITDRDGSLYMDGRPAGRDAIVQPGSDLQVIPELVGG